jgi:hypothetical protein
MKKRMAKGDNEKWNQRGQEENKIHGRREERQ